MDESIFAQIEQWHEAGENEAIIDAILAIPREQWDYRLTSFLARAYVNLPNDEHLEDALQLLLSLEEEGREDHLWHIRMGGVCARLLRRQEAEEHFRRGMSLLAPGTEKYREQEEQCRRILLLCDNELSRKAAWERYQDSLETEKALDLVLNGLFHGALPVEDRVEGNTIFLPEWGVRIRPEVEQITRQGAVLDLWLEAPQWGKELFECSMGMGSSPGSALAMSVESFLYTFMEGIERMERREEPRELETCFAGRIHRWELYPSNIVGLGNAPQPEGQVWWDALGDDIKLRLGNQRICYVKIYGAKVGGEVTGECRIDDIKSEELSAKVAALVEKWPDGKFASQKQFFFLRQSEETILPNPYEGSEGQARLRAAAVEAGRLFHACRTEEDFDRYTQRLTERIGDRTLAEECLTFLPEICAANAFPQLQAAEDVEIDRGDGAPQRVYKNQLADFYPLWTVFFQALRDGDLGEESDDIYRKFVGYSSTYHVICQIDQQGSRLEDCRLTALLCQVGEEFEIR